MTEVLLLVALAYLLVAITAIVLACEKNHTIIYNPKINFRYNLSNWQKRDKNAALVWIGYFLFLLLTANQLLFSKKYDFIYLSIPPMLLITFGTIALSIEYFKLIEAYKKYSVAIKLLILISAIFIGYKASAITDSSIAKYTSVNASNFPDAQKIIALLTTAGIWTYAAVVCGLMTYVGISLFAVFKMITSDKNSAKFDRYRRCLVGTAPKNHERASKELIMIITIIMGTSMVVIAPLGYVQRLKGTDLEKIAKNLIVETSFHLDPRLCGVSTPEGSSMSLLPLKQALVAIPDTKKNYKFALIECTRKLETFPSFSLSTDDAVK